MTDKKQASNKIEILGQVVGVYPSKRNNLPSSYRVEYRTEYIYNGRIAVTETSVFVNTLQPLPEINDVVKIEGSLNIYSYKDKDDNFQSRTSIIERTREFLGKGQPRQKQEKKTYRRGDNNNYQSRKQESSEDYLEFDSSPLDNIQY